MNSENKNPSPGGHPRDISEEELRNILGDDYDAIAGPPVPAAPAGGGSDSAAPVGGSESLTPGMSPQEAEIWARQMEQELERTPVSQGAPLVQPLQFGQLDSSGQKGNEGIEVLLDVKLPISVELGRTEMLVKEILECGPGTVIELNKLAGEPVDVFVNGRMVAQGEVVVVDEHFGVRVTNLLSPRDRVKSLA